MRGYLDASEVARNVSSLHTLSTRAEVSNVQALKAKTISHVTLRIYLSMIEHKQSFLLFVLYGGVRQ